MVEKLVETIQLVLGLVVLFLYIARLYLDSIQIFQRLGEPVTTTMVQAQEEL